MTVQAARHSNAARLSPDATLLRVCTCDGFNGGISNIVTWYVSSFGAHGQLPSSHGLAVTGMGLGRCVELLQPHEVKRLSDMQLGIACMMQPKFFKSDGRWLSATRVAARSQFMVWQSAYVVCRIGTCDLRPSPTFSSFGTSAPSPATYTFKLNSRCLLIT